MSEDDGRCSFTIRLPTSETQCWTLPEKHYLEHLDDISCWGGSDRGNRDYQKLDIDFSSTGIFSIMLENRNKDDLFGTTSSAVVPSSLMSKKLPLLDDMSMAVMGVIFAMLNMQVNMSALIQSTHDGLLVNTDPASSLSQQALK